MTEWISFVGALTGVAALIISLLSYRYAQKVNDQAISLKRDELINDIRVQFARMPTLIKEADRSKIYNLAAKGQFNSGATVVWAQTISGLSGVIDSHKKEFEAALKLDGDRVAQMKQLDHLKKVLQEHINWLNGSLREDREDVLKRA